MNHSNDIAHTQFKCNGCEAIHAAADLPTQVRGKAMGCVAGLAATSRTGNVWAMMAGAAAGVFLGHLVDEHVRPECPECANVLERVVISAIQGRLT